MHVLWEQSQMNDARPLVSLSLSLSFTLSNYETFMISHYFAHFFTHSVCFIFQACSPMEVKWIIQNSIYVTQPTLIEAHRFNNFKHLIILNRIDQNWLMAPFCKTTVFVQIYLFLHSTPQTPSHICPQLAFPMRNYI